MNPGECCKLERDLDTDLHDTKLHKSDCLGQTSSTLELHSLLHGKLKSHTIPFAYLGTVLTCGLQIWIAVELLFVFLFYVETKGPTLEEIAIIFDGDKAEVAQLDLKDIEGGSPAVRRSTFDRSGRSKDSTEVPRVVAREWS